MATMKFITIFILIHQFASALSDINIRMVHAARLQPMPYRVSEGYLLQLTLQQRKDLCNEIYTKIEEFIKLPKDNYYVPNAHMYKFDLHKCLAIQCPSFPPIYVSHGWVKDEEGSPPSHQYGVRMVRPHNIEDYEFNLEIVSNAVRAAVQDSLDQHLVKSTHAFRKMNLMTRWYICEQAMKQLRYEIEFKKEYDDQEPAFWELNYASREKQTVYAIKCFRTPEIYLHTDHGYLDEDQLIIIAIVSADEKHEMNPTKDVDIQG